MFKNPRYLGDSASPGSTRELREKLRLAWGKQDQSFFVVWREEEATGPAQPSLPGSTMQGEEPGQPYTLTLALHHSVACPVSSGSLSPILSFP